MKLVLVFTVMSTMLLLQEYLINQYHLYLLHQLQHQLHSLGIHPTQEDHQYFTTRYYGMLVLDKDLFHTHLQLTHKLVSLLTMD